MITKYTKYIKEGMYDDNYANFLINIRIVFDITSGTDRYNHIKIFTNRVKRDEIDIYFHKELYIVVKVYDKHVGNIKDYTIFQFENQLEYNYFIFYYTYIKEYMLSPIMYGPLTFESTRRLLMNVITTNDFVSEISKVLELIRNNKFEDIVDKYIETTSNLTSFVLSILLLVF